MEQGKGGGRKIWLITGPPAIGKSTVISRVVLLLRTQGYIVGGCVTEEEREKGARTGFSMLDLGTGRRGAIAAIEGGVGPRVGRYRVDLAGLAKIGVPSLLAAAKGSELVVIDEIGPMELMSPEFKRAVDVCINSGKPIMAVVREGMKDSVLDALLRDANSEMIQVTVQNRDRLPEMLFEKVKETLGPVG